MRKYSDKDIIIHVAKVKSMASLLKTLDLKTVESNYTNIQKLLQQLNINTDPWTGQSWSKDQKLKNYANMRKLILKK